MRFRSPTRQATRIPSTRASNKQMEFALAPSWAALWGYGIPSFLINTGLYWWKASDYKKLGSYGDWSEVPPAVKRDLTHRGAPPGSQQMPKRYRDDKFVNKPGYHPYPINPVVTRRYYAKRRRTIRRRAPQFGRKAMTGRSILRGTVWGRRRPMRRYRR